MTAGGELRVDPLTGAPVFIVAQRQDRPNRPKTGCPFCPGGLEAPEPYDVRWFPNRWPPLPDGRAEVVLYGPDHDGSLWSIGSPRVERVVQLWAERTAALGRRDDVSYVLIFENRGALVGATIGHPHGQIYGFDTVPPAAARELAADPCPLCAEQPAGRLISEAPGWRAWVPYAATSPYEMLLAPTEHLGDLPAAEASWSGLAELLVDVAYRLDRLFDEAMPYLFWIHQRPTDGQRWPSAHLHMHFSPLLREPGVVRFVASGEIGSGIWFNPVEPLEAAARLRAAGAAR